MNRPEPAEFDRDRQRADGRCTRRVRTAARNSNRARPGVMPRTAGRQTAYGEAGTLRAPSTSGGNGGLGTASSAPVVGALRRAHRQQAALTAPARFAPSVHSDARRGGCAPSTIGVIGHVFARPGGDKPHHENDLRPGSTWSGSHS